MPGRFNVKAQIVAQELHITGCSHESGERVRCVRFCDASHPARSWRCHSVTRGSAVGHRESRPESEGEKREPQQRQPAERWQAQGRATGCSIWQSASGGCAERRKSRGCRWQSEAETQCQITRSDEAQVHIGGRAGCTMQTAQHPWKAVCAHHSAVRFCEKDSKRRSFTTPTTTPEQR